MPHEGLPPIMGDAEAKWERYKKDVTEQKRKLDLGLDASMRGHPHKEYYQPDPSRLGEPGVHLGEDIRVEPWLTDPSIPMPDELIEEEVPTPLSPYYDPKTESGIANLMPGGPLYDRIPMGQRLNMRIAEQMRERGPHRNEPRTSYYGSNWYDEYKRKLENEMEIAKGIRSPMDR